MSLYHMVFGVNPYSALITASLRLVTSDFERFRDAYVAQGEIAVYTRLGGANRPDYEPVFARMREHPLYLRDADDTFDNTYCTFFFSLPKEFEEGLRKLDTGEVWDPGKKWEAALERMKKEGPPPSAAPLVDALRRVLG